jgi:shikimate kinase
MQNFSITLIGPGGAGKSTIASLLAERLRIRAVDLDRLFTERAGNISGYINRFGYDTYARQNVETYRLVLQEGINRTVVALSSGFMTYSPDIHPDYRRLRLDIEQSPTTFVLIPSLDRELCVAETVRRQLARSFARSRAAEEAVIRARLPLYVGLPVHKIETMESLCVIVDKICKLTQRIPDRNRSRESGTGFSTGCARGHSYD